MNKRHTSLIFTVLLALTGFSAAADEVGEVLYSRGVLTSQIPGTSPQLKGKGNALYNNETLQTGARGFAVIVLDDGTKMTLRPNTAFRIEDVNTDTGQENALFSLFKGGLRAVTGVISKLKPKGFNINTPVATIGIRGTEFDARLCEGDECDQEEQASGQTAQEESRVVGRIAVLKGQASAQEDGQENRRLSVGAAIYERDQISTGIQSFTVIAFNDKTRVTMSPQSAFRIEEHEYKPEQPEESNSFFRFLKGGMRFVTGAIGLFNKSAVRVASPTATIGIRGTGFDLICDNECSSETAMFNPERNSLASRLLNFFLKPVFAQSSSGGMYAKVWNGAIVLNLAGNQSLLLDRGKTAFLVNRTSRPRLLPDIPAALRNMGGAPRPDTVQVKEDLFAAIQQGKIEPGLYVNVRKGDVEVQGQDGNSINLGAGEAARAGGSTAGATRTVRLKVVPAFQKFDKTPDPADVSGESEMMINLFGEEGADKQEFECVIR